MSLLSAFSEQVEGGNPQKYKFFDEPVFVAGHQKEIQTLFNYERGRFNRIDGAVCIGMVPSWIRPRKILDRVFGLSFEEDIEDGKAGLKIMKYMDTWYMTSPFKESCKQLAICDFEYAHNVHLSL